MPQLALRRARQFASTGSLIPIYICGIISAIVIPLLIVNLALILQFIAVREPSAQVTLVAGPFLLQDIGFFSNLNPIFNDANPYYVIGVLVSVAVALTVLESLVLLVHWRSMQKLSYTVAAALIAGIHAQAMRLGGNEPLALAKSRPEELITEQAGKIRAGLLVWWRTIPRSIATLATLLLLACFVDILMTLLAGLLVVFMWRAYVWLKNLTEAKGRSIELLAQQRLNLIVEDIRMAPLATSYALEEIPGESFADNLVNFRNEATRREQALTLMMPLLFLIVALSAAVFLFILGMAANTTIWSTVIVGGCVLYAWFPAKRLLELKKDTDEANRAAQEVFTYLDREPNVVQIPSAQPLDVVRKSVELDRVTLAGPTGEKLLDGVTFAITAQANVGILSSDPHSAMALAGLLVRYYDPAAGRLLFDTHDIRNVTLESLRTQAALVTTNSLLFTGAVGDNVRCGNDTYSTSHVTDAAKMAAADDFIARLPQGYSTVVGEQGRQLTRSEAFRIALARAVIRNPGVLIIEEPKSGADDAALDAALKNVSANRTLLMLPNRLNTLRLLDEVILLHEGKIHARGRHAELLQNNELYRHIIYLRFNTYASNGEG